MKVLFVTSNPKKTVSPARVLNRYGIEVGHVNPEPEIMEIQAEHASQVASAKALEAFRRVGLPLFCMDAAFHIEALEGFPGVFVKQVTRQIGAEGYLKLLRSSEGGWAPRTCAFVDVLAYMDESLERPELFVRSIPGVLTDYLAPDIYPGRTKSDLFRIFAPDGGCKTLSEMTEAEYERHRRSPEVEGVFREFAEFLQG